MDARDFDRLTRALVRGGTRRGLIGLLAGLPVLGGLVAFFSEDEAAAKGRRKRRKKRHKHGKPHKRHRRKCRGQARKTLCAGRCGTVRNRCGKRINCGPCNCDPTCLICQTCDTVSGQCVDKADDTACGACGSCQGGICVPFADGTCCDDGVCVDGQCQAEATLAMCEGRCGSDDLPATFQCSGGGDAVPCPACDGGCAANGCADGGVRLMTPPATESFYCVVSVEPTGDTCAGCPADSPLPCFQPCDDPGTLCTACPAGQGCLAPFPICNEICTGTA